MFGNRKKSEVQHGDQHPTRSRREIEHLIRKQEQNQNWGRDYGIDDDQGLMERNREDFNGDYRYANQNYGRGGNEGYTDYHYGTDAEGYRAGYGNFTGTGGNFRAGARDWRSDQNASEYISAGVRGAGSGEAYPYGRAYRGTEALRGTDAGEPYSSGQYRGKGPKGYRRSDQRIHEEVCDALTHDAHVDASEIEVRVENGTVILSGAVESRRMKRAAEAAIDTLSGVDDVRNELRVDRAGSDHQKFNRPQISDRIDGQIGDSHP